MHHRQHLQRLLQWQARLSGVDAPGISRVIRDGMLWLVPYMMVWSVLLFLATTLSLVPATATAAARLVEICRAINTHLPLAICGSISTMLAIQWHLPRPPAALVTMAYMVMIEQMVEASAGNRASLTLIIALVLPVFAVPSLHWFRQMRWTALAPSSLAGENVRETLNLIIPSILTAILLIAGVMLVQALVPDSTLILDLSAWLQTQSPLVGGVVYAGANSLLWMVGVHGYYALLPLLDMLNQAAASHGSPVNEAFLGVFVFIGGSGGTLSLIAAILLGCRQKSLRVVAMAALPCSCFNVNEVLLFGVPVILNRRLALPFLLVPVINSLTTYVAVMAGWVNAPTVQVPFSSPILANALLATHGDHGAMALQLFNLVLGTLVYLPFVRLMARHKHLPALNLASVDTPFSRRQEEATILLDDPVSRAYHQEMERQSLHQHLAHLGDYDFALYFQPQIDPATGRVTGCEALLRLITPSGEARSPVAFMPWFEKAGLMPDIDLWVVDAVSRQLSSWQHSGLSSLTVTANVTADSLCNRAQVQALASSIAPHHGRIWLEITEQSLIGDEVTLRWALAQLRAAGARLYIDDFGTGYSSLSYLHLFDLDGIKIDRSFVLALDTPRGQRVFQGLVAMAEQLELALIVEGVETEAQLKFVPRSHSASVQGWLYAPALPPDDFLAYVHQQGWGRQSPGHPAT